MHVFDRIYVINLKSRPDRMRSAASELKRIGLAVDGERVKFFDAVRPEETGGFPSIGAHGCFRSHLGAIKLAARESASAFLILEDDIVFPADFNTAAEPVLSALAEQPWDIFYGGHEKVETGDDLLSRLAPEQAVLTAHCVGFKAAHTADLAAYLEAMLTRAPKSDEGGPMHVDGAYSWYRRARPHLQTFAASSPIASQRPSRSDITPRSLLDKTPVVKDLLELARQLRAKATLNR